MIRREGELRGNAWILSRQAFAFMWIPILIISSAHYLSNPHMHWMHDLLRRIYYIPIVLAAFTFGVRGALVTSIVTSVVYFPHAFTMGHHYDPGQSIEKVLELLLYNVIAYITGTLADRELRERLLQEKIARQLKDSLDELKSMEQQILRSERLRALGELTAGLAHEIKNPLASLKGATQIVSDEIAPDSPRRRMIEIMDKELDRLGAILERFLSFARPKKVDFSRVQIDALINPLVELIRTQARTNNSDIEWNPQASELHVDGDKESLALVIMNILLNAVQAMPNGGTISVHAQAVTCRKQSFCEITVADQGPGIPQEMREVVFNPFVTTKPGGSGLGLSIAARVVDSHSGFIEIADNKDKGTIFRILLPVGRHNP